MTNRENYEHQWAHHYSLVIKRFALSTIVVSLGLVLSVLSHAKFGHQLMAYIHSKLNAQPGLGETAEATMGAVSIGIWELVTGGTAASIGTTRLQNRVYAYTVLLGLPYVMRLLGRVQRGAAGWNGKVSATGGEETKEEQELLVRIRREVSLGGECDMFERYLEVVTQFGYVVFWSAIWPLAPGASLFK